MPEQLQGAGFLPGGFHLDKGDPAAGKKDQAVRNTCHARRNKLQGEASRLIHRADQHPLKRLFLHQQTPSHDRKTDGTVFPTRVYICVCLCFVLFIFFFKSIYMESCLICHRHIIGQPGKNRGSLYSYGLKPGSAVFSPRRSRKNINPEKDNDSAE